MKVTFCVPNRDHQHGVVRNKQRKGVVRKREVVVPLSDKDWKTERNDGEVVVRSVEQSEKAESCGPDPIVWPGILPVHLVGERGRFSGRSPSYA